MSRLICFFKCVILIIAALSIMYAMRLAGTYDPELRGIDLIVMSIAALACLIMAVIQLGKVIFPTPTTSTLDDYYP